MSSSNSLNVRPDTIARNLTNVSGPNNTLSLDCDDFYGTPILPASDTLHCGTKTSNETLMSACCNGAEVSAYLGCFMYCPLENFSGTTGTRMRDFVSCLSSNGTDTAPSNATNIDPNVFCQSELQGGVNATTSGGPRSSTATSSSSFSYILSLTLIVLLLCDAATAECRLATADSPDFARIKQAEARQFGAGVSCGDGSQSPFCVYGFSGPAHIEAFNRTIGGNDASDARYDEFFEVLGEIVEPARLFPATSWVRVTQWNVGGVGSSLVNYNLWAPFIYCVSVVSADCFDGDNEEGIFEACGPLFQSGTGLGDHDPIVQGVFMRGSR